MTVAQQKAPVPAEACPQTITPNLGNTASNRLVDLVREALNEHGEDWPRGLQVRMAAQVGCTRSAVSAAKRRALAVRAELPGIVAPAQVEEEVEPVVAIPVQQTNPEPEPVPASEPETPGAELPQERWDYIAGRAGGDAYSPELIDWLVTGGYLRGMTWEELQENKQFYFPKAEKTETGGLLICHNPRATAPHYQLRCDVAPFDEERGRHAKYLMQAGAGERLAVWDPSGLVGPDGETVGQARIGTEGFFDAVYCTFVLGIPCMAITAPSHLRVLSLPEHLKLYLGDCDQWMAQDLLPTVVRGCVTKGLKLARLPLVESHRGDYLKPHPQLPNGAKGGMEELGQENGIKAAKSIIEAAVASAYEPGDYLSWEIKELSALGLCWPDHSVSLTNLICAVGDAHPNNKLKREALKAEILLVIPGLTAKPVNDGIRERLARRSAADQREKQDAREEENNRALARGEVLEPDIDKEDPTNQQLQLFMNYAYEIRFNELTRAPEMDGKAITDVKLTNQLLAHQHGIEAKKQAAEDALMFVAKSNPYNPVEEYLQRIRCDVAVEPLPAETIFKIFGIAPGDALSRELLQRSLVGSVKRGLEPGCKFDACPILRGKQGGGKTEILRALATMAWYDGIGDYGSSSNLALSGWAVMAKANGTWLFELGEVERLTQGRCQSAFKDWLTERVAKYAEKNQALATEHARRFVPWGTTNEAELLNDSTGSRRFWIIECVGTILWQMAAEHRNEIWKAALVWMDQGMESWLNPETESGAAAIKAAADRGLEATFTDPWLAEIIDYLDAVVLADSNCSKPDRLELARNGKWKTVQPVGDGVKVLRLRYIPVGHKSSDQLALIVTFGDLYEHLDYKPAQQSKGSSARLSTVMRHHQILATGWAAKKTSKVRGFALHLGAGNLGSDSGSDCDSRMGIKNDHGDCDPGSIPILLEEVDKAKGKTILFDLVNNANDLNPNGATDGITQRMGTKLNPTAEAKSWIRFENENQEKGPENGNQSTELPIQGAFSIDIEPVVNSSSTKKKSKLVHKSAALLIPPPAVIAPVPRPYLGEPLPGIDYIHRAQDLPNPDGLPMLCGFDLETWNKRTDVWRHKASLFPFLGGEIRLAQVFDGTNTLVIDVALIGQTAIDWLHVLARDCERTLVGHNLLFEATHLIGAGIRPLCKWWDTMLASQTIGGLKEANLQAVAKHYIEKDLSKFEQAGDWGNAITESKLRYAAIDAQVVLPLREALLAELEATKQVEVHRLDCCRISPAADGQDRGLAIDAAALDEIEAAATAEWDPKRTQLHAMLGLPNPEPTESQPYASTEQVHPRLVEALDGEQLTKGVKNKETGEWEDRPSTEKKVLQKFAGVPVVDLLMEVRDLDRTLLEVNQLRRDLEFAGGRTRPDYRLLGANTGRITTSGQIGAKDLGTTGRVINGKKERITSDSEVYKTGKRQGLPREIKLPSQIGSNFQGLSSRVKRALWTGNPDSLLLDIDWGSQEIRLQASPRLYNDRGFRRMILDGIDPHALMACTLFDLELPEDGIVKKDWVEPHQRSAAKPANFSLPYGCFVASLRRALSAAQGVAVSWEKAQAVYDTWHEFHRETSLKMDRFDPKKPGGGSIYECRSLAGRRVCHWGKAPKPDGTVPQFRIGRTNGVNWPIQSSGADMMSETLAEIWPALDRFPGTRIIGLVHDALLLEVPRSMAEEVKAIVVGAMTSDRLRDRYYGDIPLVADANFGENWEVAHNPLLKPNSEEVGNLMGHRCCPCPSA